MRRYLTTACRLTSKCFVMDCLGRLEDALSELVVGKEIVVDVLVGGEMYRCL